MRRLAHLPHPIATFTSNTYCANIDIRSGGSWPEKKGPAVTYKKLKGQGHGKTQRQQRHELPMKRIALSSLIFALMFTRNVPARHLSVLIVTRHTNISKSSTFAFTHFAVIFMFYPVASFGLFHVFSLLNCKGCTLL